MTTLTIVLIVACCGAADEPVARDIVRDQVKPNGQTSQTLIDATGWQTVHSFTWQMLAVDAENGTQKPVDPNQVFSTGTAFKLQVKTATDLYIYVLNENAGGGVETLFPNQCEPHLLIKRGCEAKVPPDPPAPRRDQFRFTRPAGKQPPYCERFYIIASPQQLPWANPAQHLPPEQKAANAKSLDKLKRAETNAVRGKTLADMVEECKKNPAASPKNVTLLPPPTDGGQQVIQASATVNDEKPFLAPVVLQHK